MPWPLPVPSILNLNFKFKSPAAVREWYNSPMPEALDVDLPLL